MRPEDVFSIVLDRVREYQALREPVLHQKVKISRTKGKIIKQVTTIKGQTASRGHLTSIRPDACAKDGPRPVGNVGAEYIADFSLCGMKALRREAKVCISTFRLYFVDGLPGGEVRRRLKITSDSLDWRCERIRKVVGHALKRTPLFPPSNYRRLVPIYSPVTEARK